MNFSKKLLIGAFSMIALSLFGKAPDLSIKQLASPPGKIIRTCCSFGSDVQLQIIPGIKITDITSLDKIGAHQFLGNLEEGNGIIYTQKGGFIDMGHLRDMADWTAYLYVLIRESQQDGGRQIRLKREGGSKKLDLWIPHDLNKKDAISLAGKIAYDFSVWHEIATWFGASYIPMLHEKYSSFSIEDAYSNLLGVRLGMEALESDLPYDLAMTQLVENMLLDFKAVETEAETYAAMEQVLEVWWTREKRLPSPEILLQRQLKVYPTVEPWLVPGWAANDVLTSSLEVPLFTEDGQPLTDLYELRLKLNHKFPFRKMFPFRKKRVITEDDFDVMIDRVAIELRESGLEFRGESN